MDSVMGKFSVFDFFNLIGTGIVFGLGLELLGINAVGFLYGMIEIDVGSTVLNLIRTALLLCACYVMGSVIQALGTFLDTRLFKIQGREIASFFRSDGALKNQVKIKVYTDKAKALFDLKGIKYDESNGFTKDQCEYFFSYCIYYIQTKGNQGKTEKMRELQGLLTMLSTCFAALFAVAVGRTAYALIVGKFIWYYPVLIAAYAFLAVMFFFKMRYEVRNRLKMTIGTYEVTSDQ